MSWKWICSSFLVEVTLANLVKKFDWKVDVGAMGDDKPDVAEAIGIDVCRMDPLIVNLSIFCLILHVRVVLKCVKYVRSTIM